MEPSPCDFITLREVFSSECTIYDQACDVLIVYADRLLFFRKSKALRLPWEIGNPGGWAHLDSKKFRILQLQKSDITALVAGPLYRRSQSFLRKEAVGRQLRIEWRGKPVLLFIPEREIGTLFEDLQNWAPAVYRENHVPFPEPGGVSNLLGSATFLLGAIVAVLLGLSISASLDLGYAGPYVVMLLPFFYLALPPASQALRHRLEAAPRRARTRDLSHHQPLRSRPLSWIVKLAGVLLFLATWWLQLYLICLLGIESGVTFVIWPLYVLSAVVIYIGYRLGLPSADRLIAGDTRPPILFLRAFHDDGHHNLNIDTWLNQWLGLKPFSFLQIFGPLANINPIRIFRVFALNAIDTSEEQCAVYFLRHGPFLAIGKPGEKLSHGGAAKMYVSDDSWRETILDYIDRSQLVILQPGTGQGVWWEIQQLISRADPRKVVFCFASFRHSPRAYEDFQRRFSEAIQRRVPPYFGDAFFMIFDHDWNPTLLPTYYKTPLFWPLTPSTIDFDRTFAPYFQHAQPLPSRPVDSFAFSSLFALLFWGIALFGLDNCIGYFIGLSAGPAAARELARELNESRDACQYRSPNYTHSPTLALCPPWTRTAPLGSEIFQVGAFVFLQRGDRDLDIDTSTQNLENQMALALAGINVTTVQDIHACAPDILKAVSASAQNVQSSFLTVGGTDYLQVTCQNSGGARIIQRYCLDNQRIYYLQASCSDAYFPLFHDSILKALDSATLPK